MGNINYPLETLDVAILSGKTAAAVRYAGHEMPSDLAQHLPNGRWIFSEQAVDFMRNRGRGRYRKLPIDITLKCSKCGYENRFIQKDNSDLNSGVITCKECGVELIILEEEDCVAQTSKLDFKSVEQYFEKKKLPRYPLYPLKTWEVAEQTGRSLNEVIGIRRNLPDDMVKYSDRRWFFSEKAVGFLRKYSLKMKDVTLLSGKTVAVVINARDKLSSDMAQCLPNGRWIFSEQAVDFIKMNPDSIKRPRLIRIPLKRIGMSLSPEAIEVLRRPDFDLTELVKQYSDVIVPAGYQKRIKGGRKSVYLSFLPDVYAIIKSKENQTRFIEMICMQFKSEGRVYAGSARALEGFVEDLSAI